MVRTGVFAAVAVAVVAAFVWLGGGSAPTPDAPEVDPNPASARAAAATGVGERALVAATGESTSAAPERRAVDPDLAWSLDVAVLAPDDAPVPGVTVELRARMPGSGGSGGQVARATTGPDGRATLVPTADEARRIDALEALGVTLEFEVGADVPQPDPPRAPVPPGHASDEPIVLRIAPSGSAVVHLTGPDGEPVADGGRVYLFWRAPGTGGAWEREGLPSARGQGGTARFPIVPLDRELSFRASGVAGFSSGATTVLGPTRPGDSVAATIRLGPPSPKLVARVVDERGAPLGRASISVAIVMLPRDAPPGAIPERHRIGFHGRTTDAEGGFEDRVEGALDPDRRRALVVEHDQSRTAAGGEVVRRAVVSLDFELRAGSTHDVGTITLIPEAEERTLVTGRVVGERGEPVPGASVSAGHWDRESGSWRRLHRGEVPLGADGGFEIRTAMEPPDTFQVSAGANRHVGVTVEATPGARGLELVLSVGGTLRARAAVPDGVPPQLLVGRIGKREPNQFAGRFGADGLAPGRHDVTVRIAGTGWEVGRVDGVVVPAGGTADDARLDGIPVACRSLRLRVIGIDDRPVADAAVRIDGPAGRGGSFRSDRDGRVVAAAPTSIEAFVVRGPDGASADVRWSAVEQRVRLARR